ncbi:MAG: carbonic anhydrase [Nitratireductor sp.]|nr:carbonic anhydrase [Nitratireductor sp.]MCB1457675.1 carbonic anhydrase [Nitratireductor sp.]
MAREKVDPGFPSKLGDGYKAFYYGRLRHERDRYERLAASGQKPEVMIIACCDSRAAPELIFDAAPGEVFVVRNVANMVPPYAPDDEYHGTSAALEFAVQVLKVKHIVVIGHGKCGGVNAFREQLEGISTEPLSPGDFIGKWITLLEPATRDIRCEDADSVIARQRALEEAAIRNSIANLKTFPCVNILLDRQQLQVHGSWFDISSGELWLMDPQTGDFSPAQT